jgi:hypothetical protein
MDRVQQPADAESSEPVLMRCPRCRLSLSQRHRSLGVEFCPRCIAHAHVPVRMLPIAPAPTSRG